MPLEVASVDGMQEYLCGVLGRADHHAEAVQDIALALVGAVVWRKVGTLEVRTYAGEPANIIWFHTEKARYALAFNHKTQQIELRERTQTGNVLHTFNNQTPLSEVRTVFANL